LTYRRLSILIRIALGNGLGSDTRNIGTGTLLGDMLGGWLRSGEQALNEYVAEEEEKGKEGKGLRSMFQSTSSKSRSIIAAPVSSPALGGKDERREPQVGKDQAEWQEMTAITLP